MPRDSGGVYTLPSGNPVVDGTLITTTWANPTMSDIAVQLNNVITRDGLLGFINPVKAIDGSAAAPSYSFTSAPTIGMYRQASTLRFSVLGSYIGGWSSTGLEVVGNITPEADGTRNLGSASLHYFQTFTQAVQRATAGALTINASNAAGTIALRTAGSDRVTVSAAGNVTIAAPSSGTSLAVSNVSPHAAAQLGNVFVGANVGFINPGANIWSQSSSAMAIGTIDAQDFVLWTNSSQRISIAAAGNVTINAPASGTALTVNGVTGQFIAAFGVSSGSAAISVSGPAGNARYYQLATAGSPRWLLEASSAAESGSNVGSNFNLSRFDDAGAFIGTPLSIARNTGAVTINAPSSGDHLTLSGSPCTLRLGSNGSLASDGTQTFLRGNGIVIQNGAASTTFVNVNNSGRIQLGTTGTQWEIDTSNRLLNPGNTQPLLMGSASTNRTTTGTFAGYSASSVNRYSAFNESTGIYTTPTAGVYLIVANGIGFTSSGTGAAQIRLKYAGGDVRILNVTLGTTQQDWMICSVVQVSTAGQTLYAELLSISGTGATVGIRDLQIVQLF